MKKTLLAVITALLISGCSGVTSGSTGFTVVSRSEDALKFNGSLAVGYDRSAYINETRELIMIGEGYSDPSDADYAPEVLLKNTESVAAGTGFFMAVTLNHELYAWGDVPDFGKNQSYTIPQMILSDVKEAVACDSFGLAVTMDNKLYGIAYKSNSIRKLMDNVKHVRSAFRGNSVNGETIAYITTDDELYMWGNNYGGEMTEDYDIEYVSDPVKVADHIKDIAIGPLYSILLTTDNTLQAVGRYSEKKQFINEVILPSEEEDILLSQIKQGINSIEAIGVCGYMYLVLDQEGKLSCYGRDLYGYNAFSGLIAENVRYFAANTLAVMYMTEDKQLYGFGDCLAGQFGNKIQEYNTQPQLILDMQKRSYSNESSSFSPTPGSQDNGGSGKLSFTPPILIRNNWESSCIKAGFLSGSMKKYSSTDYSNYNTSDSEMSYIIQTDNYKDLINAEGTPLYVVSYQYDPLKRVLTNTFESFPSELTGCYIAFNDGSTYGGDKCSSNTIFHYTETFNEQGFPVSYASDDQRDYKTEYEYQSETGTVLVIISNEEWEYRDETEYDSNGKFLSSRMVNDDSVYNSHCVYDQYGNQIEYHYESSSAQGDTYSYSSFNEIEYSFGKKVKVTSRDDSGNVIGETRYKYEGDNLIETRSEKSLVKYYYDKNNLWSRVERFIKNTSGEWFLDCCEIYEYN